MRLSRTPRALARFSGVTTMTPVGRKKLKPSQVTLVPSCRLLAPAISSPSACVVSCQHTSARAMRALPRTVMNTSSVYTCAV